MTVMNTGQWLDLGQEEVFVREEFEISRLEHHWGEETTAWGIERPAPIAESQDASPRPRAGYSNQSAPHLGPNGQPKE